MKNNTSFFRNHVYPWHSFRFKLNINGIDRTFTAPKNAVILDHSIYNDKNLVFYATIEQLNTCEANIVTTHAYRVEQNGVYPLEWFQNELYLVSYNTVVTCYRLQSHEDYRLSKQNICYLEIGDMWNYSRTTVQHVYKFLKHVGLGNLHVSDVCDKLNKWDCSSIKTCNSVGVDCVVSRMSNIPSYMGKGNAKWLIFELWGM